MNITRHNYEEFFILYMDNELSSDDRRQVELFVQENPDLGRELELLLQTRLTPDDSVVYDMKQQLLRSASPAPINESNFEEWLLLYVDNELTGQEKIEVEKFLAHHPSAKTGLDYLLRTKLQPDPAIVFTNKETLYRREKRATVIALHWRKIAVAASLLLAVGTAAFLVFTGKDNNEGKLITKQTPAANSIKDDSANNNMAVEPVTSENNKTTEAGEEPLNNLAVTEQEKFIAENKKNDQRTALSADRDTKFIVENKSTTQQTNNLPGPADNPGVTKDAAENPIAMVDAREKDALTDIIDNKPIGVVTPDIASSLNDGKAAVTIEPDYALVTDESGKKNKLRGFFRKVTRTFEKRTNIKATDDEDRLLLAGLSIKL